MLSCAGFLNALDWNNFFQISEKFMNFETKSLHGANSEDFVIVTCVVLIHYRSVTDTRADTHTNGRVYHN